MNRPLPARRADFRYFHALSTRWKDNDVFGHVNNVEYYSFFDSCVCTHLLESGLLHITGSDAIPVVVESRCTYHASAAFPDRITVGMRVGRMGGSSVRYELAVFRNDDDSAAAEGYFTHVYVARETMRPVPLPDAVRATLRPLTPPQPTPPG